MKNVYIIGGTMGVGKTAVCRIMSRMLDNSVFLDGDWCWSAHPFLVTEETKQMVMQNIHFLLNQFIGCTAYENVIFCWVMHEQSIIDEVLAGIGTENCTLHVLSLTCDEAELLSRLRGDIDAGIRTEDIIDRSVPRLKNYTSLNTVKIDTNGKTATQVAEEIISLLNFPAISNSVRSD